MQAKAIFCNHTVTFPCFTEDLLKPQAKPESAKMADPAKRDTKPAQNRQLIHRTAPNLASI